MLVSGAHVFSETGPVNKCTESSQGRFGNDAAAAETVWLPEGFQTYWWERRALARVAA